MKTQLFQSSRFGLMALLALLSFCSMAQSALPAPTNLTATAQAYNSVLLQWKDNSGESETGFEIYRDPGLGTNFQLIATVGKNATSYQDQSVEGNRLYYYRVRAITPSLQSASSNQVSVTTPVSPPAAPSGLSASLSSTTSAHLTWDGNNSGGTVFLVERANRTMGSAFVQIARVDYSRTLFYDDNGLSSGTEYCYRVRANNESGNSGYSNTSCVTTATTIPNAPVRLAATAISSNRIDLSWADVSDNEGGFEIERSTDGRNFSKIADANSNATTYSSVGLDALTRYWYRVRAKNGAGNSGYSNTADATTLAPPVNAPRPPSALTLSVISASQINLSWTDNADNETGFEVERSTDGTNFTKIADLTSNTTSFNNTALNAATRYWYRVRAQNSGGASSYSNIADATTSQLAPVAPARLTATAISYQQVDLAWADISSNENTFHIERSTDGTSFTEIATIVANSTSYQDKSVLPVTRYFYRVKASNAIGSSAYSNVAEVTTPQAPLPDQPKNLTAVPLDFDLVQLRWSTLSANSVEVVIERSKKPNEGFIQIGKQAASIIQFQDREILDVENYYYRIKATNAAGSSPYGEVVEVPAAAIITGIEPASGDFVYVNDKILFVKRTQQTASTLTLYDLKGIPIKQLPIKHNEQLNLSSIAPGSYIVEIAGVQKIIRYKIAVF